jgi:nitrite reductase (NO-forming)
MLPVIETEPTRRGPDRRVDRRITWLGLATAIGFVIAAVTSLALPVDARLGTWLPLHLVLAGAAGTAIAAMLPFFVAALAVASPAPAALRTASLLLVSGGAVAGVLGRVAAGGGIGFLAAVGAAAYVCGMAAVGLAAAFPLRRATGPRRPVTELAYAVGLIDVMVGVSLVALYVAGDGAVAARWPTLRVAHAWLNLLGFVTLVIAGTLVHFVPTVVGSRIRRRRSAGVAIACLVVAAPLTAIGYALVPGGAGGVLVGLGVTAAITGALTLMAHGIRAWRDRAGWTSDMGWHAFTGGSLLIAPGWLLAAALIASVGIILHGADPVGWRLDQVGAPLVVGFVAQVLLGALSHLLPAVGPGSPEAHAAQRRILGRDGPVRLGGWNLGVALLTIGMVSAVDVVALAGLALIVTTALATVALLAAALRTR